MTQNGWNGKVRLAIYVGIPLVTFTLWLGNTHWMAEANKEKLCEHIEDADCNYDKLEVRIRNVEHTTAEIKTEQRIQTKMLERIESKLL